MMGVLVAGGVSGGHLNPAISLAFHLTRQISFAQFVVFSIAQVIGAALGGAMVYVNYYGKVVILLSRLRALDALHAFILSNPQPNASIGMLGTYPSAYLSLRGAIVDQIFATFLLAAGVWAISDQRNLRIPPFVGAIFVALLNALIGMTHGMNAGAAVNPARELGPRLVALAVGDWGHQVFT